MNTINNKFLVFALVVSVLLFLYFDGGIMIGGRANGDGWFGINGWLWFLTLITIEFGVALSWLHLKKKS